MEQSLSYLFPLNVFVVKEREGDSVSFLSEVAPMINEQLVQKNKIGCPCEPAPGTALYLSTALKNPTHCPAHGHIRL